MFYILLMIVFSTTYSKYIVLTLIMIWMVMVKLLVNRSHFLSFLLLIELMMLLILLLSVFFNLNSLISSTWFMCHFIVMVCGASLGMSLLVNYTRSLSKEMEMFFMNLYN